MPTSTEMEAKAHAYLRRLCLDIPGRNVGSTGNRTATDFFASTMASFDFAVVTPMFECIDWSQAGVDLSVGDAQFQAFASPYASGCFVDAPLVAVSTIGELESTDLHGKILLLYDEIARHQLMPKNFPFYNPDEHKHIIRMLETKQPLAIITATTRDPEMVGSLYPFPLIEDGDFDIPSVYMTDMEGRRLLMHAGSRVALQSRAHRIPAQGFNVIARKGSSFNRRTVLVAHIDAKLGTPGALDNASGIVVLLLLAELLSDYSGAIGIEVVAMNGEDYFSSPGEQQYLMLNSGRFDEIILGINIDGVGYHKGSIAYSLYDCPAEIANLVNDCMARYAGIVSGDPWYQGDHVLFLLNQCPALAFTSQLVTELMTQVIHTAADRPEIIEPSMLVQLAQSLHDLVLRLDS